LDVRFQARIREGFAECGPNSDGSMPDSAEAVVNAPPRGVEEIVSETGAPSHNRRMRDKVLAAFNHAYAVGEIEVAAKLREILAKLEHKLLLAHGQRQPTSVTLSHADLWVEFVEARNDYLMACEDESLDSEAVTGFLDRMKDAYQCWNSF